MDRPSSFLVSLPKAELHLHLEGSIDPTTLVELRKRHGKTSTLAEIEQLYRYEDFNGFLLAFKAVTEDLKTPDDYEFITYRLMERLKAENVLHAEVYVSVGVCLWRKQDFDAIFEGLDRGRRKGERDFGVSLLWIFDAVRQFGPGAAREVFGAALRHRDPELVEELAARQVPLEICLTSNLRTGACPSLSAHPVRQYFDQGLMITLNTDDPAMFRTSLSREYQLAQQLFSFTDEHLRELARNSFEASFLPAEKKLTFLNLFDAAAAHT